MRFHFHTVAVHSDGSADAVLSIHHKTALDDVDDLAVVGNGNCLGSFQCAGNIQFVDDAAGNAYYAAAVDRGNMRTCQADQRRGDFKP